MRFSAINEISLDLLLLRWTEVKDTHCWWSENWLKDVKIPSAKDFALILCGSRNMFV